MRTRHHRSGRPAGAVTAPAFSTARLVPPPPLDRRIPQRAFLPHHLRSRSAMSLSCRQEKVFCGRARNTTRAAPRPPSADIFPRPGRCRGDGAAPARSPAPLTSVPPPVRAGRLGCPPFLCCLPTKSLNSTPTFSPLPSLPVSAPGKLRFSQQAEAGAAIAAFAKATPVTKHQN